MTREEWLNQMKKHLESVFETQGYQTDNKVRVSCGLPSNRAFSARSKTIGQCFSNTISTDKTSEIFISPTIDDSVEVSATLAHEMVHAIVGVENGHKKPFRDCATSIGLIGKMTATKANQYLISVIEEKILELGEYPHAKMDYTKQKKQGTRLLKVVCENDDCDYIVNEGKNYVARLSGLALSYGVPNCGCCGKQMVEI